MGFVNCPQGAVHYNDIIMGTMASQITSLAIVYSTVYSVADQRKHQNSAPLVNSPHKWPVARKMFPFEDVIMLTYVWLWLSSCIPSSSVDIISFSSPELSGFFQLFPLMPHICAADLGQYWLDNDPVKMIITLIPAITRCHITLW